MEGHSFSLDRPSSPNPRFAVFCPFPMISGDGPTYLSPDYAFPINGDVVSDSEVAGHIEIFFVALASVDPAGHR